MPSVTTRVRTVPRRSGWLQLLTVAGLMVGGPYMGLRLATGLTPESDVVQAVSPLAFGVILAGGLLIWMGVGIVSVVAAFVWSLLRGRNPREGAPGREEAIVPPGSRIFIVLGVVLGGAAGCLAGLLGDRGFLVPAGIWSAAGAAYGTALWAAARSGYLPFPEPE